MCLAVPGKIVSVSPGEGLERSGRVSFGGVIKEVNLAFVPEAQVGDYVMVHVGFALSRVDEREAEQIFTYLAELEAEEPAGESAVARGSQRSGESPP
jgi:hydrogenase expression/formation protein HypC